MDLTVACLWWGNWCGRAGPDYVSRLRNMAQRWAPPHRFVCFTDRPEALPGIEILPMGVPGWRWNLRKMALYRPRNGLEGRVLALDLDTVIVGPIDDLAAYAGRFCVLEDFYETGKAGGGVISFRAGSLAGDLYDPLLKEADSAGLMRLRGSERLWYRERMPNADFWQRLYPGRIVSFKPRPDKRLKRPPPTASIICFHGRPRPHEVDIPWVSDHWR